MIKYFFFVGCLFMLSSCHNITGSGKMVSKNRTVANFTSVKVNNGIRIIISSGESIKLSVEADDNIIDEVETKVSGDELVVGFSDDFSFNNADITLNVVMPMVKMLTASGGSSIRSNNQLPKTDDMILKASGGSSINVEVDTRTIDMKSSGGASLNVKGRSQIVNIDASGGESVDAYELLAETAKLKSSGGASLRAFASLNVDADASSGASINYKGNPSGSIRKNESGGGSVTNKD